MIVFFDTEFTDLHPEARLISIGLVSEDGRSFYAELSDTYEPSDMGNFAQVAVLPLLEGGTARMTMNQLAERLAAWVAAFGEPVRLATDSLAWDWAWLQEIFYDRPWPDHLDGKPLLLTMNYLNDYDKFIDGMEMAFARGLRRHHALDDAKAIRLGWIAAGGAMDPPDPLAVKLPRALADWKTVPAVGREMVSPDPVDAQAMQEQDVSGKPGAMILFLDFDGVLHPESDDGPIPEEMAFCHLPRFEAIMRAFPAVEIVISSMWRYVLPIEKLKEHFSEDIRMRIVGSTPLIERVEGKYLPARREDEILQWLAENDRQGAEWIALDDALWQFQDHLGRVVACVPSRGLDEATGEVLRARLQELGQ